MRGPFEVLSLDLAPGAASGDEPLGHDSDECIIVLCGTIEIEMAGQLYDLDEGDSITVPRNLPHRVVNVGRAPVRGVDGHQSAGDLLMLGPVDRHARHTRAAG